MTPLIPLIPRTPRQLEKKYLVFARGAADYVNRKLFIGRGNDVLDVITSLGESRICTNLSRDASKAAEDAMDWPSKIRAMARRAEREGCGNCAECAAVAFCYLELRPVRPLEYMMLAKPADHAFVVVGRKADSDIADVFTWGPAVICDGWDRPGKAYPAKDVQGNMYANGRAMIHLAMCRHRLD